MCNNRQPHPQEDAEQGYLEGLLREAPLPLNCAKLCVPLSAAAQVCAHAVRSAPGCLGTRGFVAGQKPTGSAALQVPCVELGFNSSQEPASAPWVQAAIEAQLRQSFPLLAFHSRYCLHLSPELPRQQQQQRHSGTQLLGAPAQLKMTCNCRCPMHAGAPRSSAAAAAPRAWW